jgi:hypothetical protein
MLSNRFAVVDNYPFRRLATLLEGVAPATGAYLTHAGADRVNHGLPDIRIALVYDLDTTEAALARLARVL